MITLIRIFERVRLVSELKFLVSFCILIILNHLLTYYENFKSEAHYILVYFSQNIWRSQIGLRTPIFGQFLHFDDLQAFNYLRLKLPAWDSWHENWPVSSRLWKGQIYWGIWIFGHFFAFFGPATVYKPMIKIWAWVLWHENGSFFFVILWSLQAVGILWNLTDLQILITEEITKTFRLTKILRKMTWKDISRAPGLLRISSVNVTKSAGNCRFGHIYWRNC